MILTEVRIVCRSKNVSGTNNEYYIRFTESTEEVDQMLFGKDSPIVIEYKHNKGVLRVHKEDILNTNVYELEVEEDAPEPEPDKAPEPEKEPVQSKLELVEK